jgi:hypothetical protein
MAAAFCTFVRWPRDLDAEMIARLPVATAEDHHNLFMATDGVVPGMQDADASLLAGSGGGIRRGLLITHPRPQRLANEATCRGARAEPVGRRES